MPEIDLVSALREFSFWAIFMVLYLRERQRSKELSDERVADLKRWIDTLTAIQISARGRVTLLDDTHPPTRGTGD